MNHHPLLFFNYYLSVDRCHSSSWLCCNIILCTHTNTSAPSSPSPSTVNKFLYFFSTFIVSLKCKQNVGACRMMFVQFVTLFIHSSINRKMKRSINSVDNFSFYHFISFFLLFYSSKDKSTKTKNVDKTKTKETSLRERAVAKLKILNFNINWDVHMKPCG